MKDDSVSASNPRQRFLSRVWRVRWLIFVMMFTGLVAWPIQNRMSRVAILAMVAMAIMRVLWSASCSRIVLRVTLALITLLIGLPLSPIRPIDHSRLREDYLAALQEFEGTTYVWGGEGRLGIDCSGLVRSAMRTSLIRTALVTANPGLCRVAFSIWWNDCTARQLGEAYRGSTQPVCTADSINALSPDNLQVGDLAIVAGGRHVLAYLGNQSWIEADPNRGRVTVDYAPDPANRWLCSPAQIVRWNLCSSE